MSRTLLYSTVNRLGVQCESKPPPEVFWHFPLTHPSLINCPRSGWPLSNFGMNRIFSETRMFGHSEGEIISSFWYNTGVRQTDGQTDGRTSLLWLYQHLHSFLCYHAGKSGNKISCRKLLERIIITITITITLIIIIIISSNAEIKNMCGVWIKLKINEARIKTMENR